MNGKPMLVTIDGPAGAGKTTVSRLLAERLGYKYIDTGALYRGVACEVIAHEIDPGDDAAIRQLCAEIDLQFVRTPLGVRLVSSGRDLTDEIRTPQVTMLASALSAKPFVRQVLLEVQRDLGAQKSAVFEGRDMGTVVFPDADVKFFLTADLNTRAIRRLEEFRQSNDQTLDAVKEEMKRRDENDSSRRIAPLKAADDAVVIDSTDLDVDEVIEKMIDHVRMTGLE